MEQQEQNPFGKMEPVLVAVAGVIFLLGYIRSFGDVIDDAYITFRYVQRWIETGELAYNSGMVVEGFSTPLFVFLLAPFELLSMPLPVAAHIIGIVSFVFCAAITLPIVTALGGKAWQALLAALGVLSSFPLLYYSVTGMETGLFAALIAVGIFLFYKEGNRVGLLGAFVWCLVAITRPEGILYPFLIGVVELVLLIKTKGKTKEHITSVVSLIGVGVVFCLFLVWRKMIFDAWVPNTFIAKPAGSGSHKAEYSALYESLKYLGEFMLQTGILFPIIALYAAIRYFLRLRVVCLTFFAGLVFGLYTGGDWMVGGRYFLPILVPLFALGAFALDDILRWIQKKEIKKSLSSLLLILPLLASFVYSIGSIVEFTVNRDRVPFHVMNTELLSEVAIQMKEDFGDDHLVVAHRIGALGYFTDWEIIDLFGLVDREIAQAILSYPQYHPGFERGNDVPELKQLIASREPTLLFVVDAAPRTENLVLDYYGMEWSFAQSYQIGGDQWWKVYQATPEE